MNPKTTRLRKETGARLASVVILAVVAAECTVSETERDPCMWPTAHEARASVLMVPERMTKPVAVRPDETLGEAMVRTGLADPWTGEILAQQSGQEEESVCVPENLEERPEGSVACRCYEYTQCKGGESPKCERHCKKDKCRCCQV